MAQDTKILYHRFSVKISLTNSILVGYTAEYRKKN